MTKETCRPCAETEGFTVKPDDDLALCQGHWNAWLNLYLNLYPGHNVDPAPCAAHLIREGQ